MNWRIEMLSMLAATLLVGGNCWAAGPQAGCADQPPAASSRPSLTVFPIVITPGENIPATIPKAIAEVVGVFLERAGLEQVEVAEAKFSPPDTDDVTQVAAAFGKTVRERAINTDYALYGELFGTPGSGVKAIRTVVVDQNGKVLLADRDDQQTFARTSDVPPKDPMTCSLFLAKKLQKLWGLADPTREAPPGKLELGMRQRSGVPSEKERADMTKRLAVMRKGLETSRLTVYPVRIGQDTDKPCAAQLVEMLSERDVCRAVSSDADPRLQVPGDRNEQKVLWDAARAFRRFVRENPPATEYALYADYGLVRSSSGEAKVRYVHLILCDRAGDWVLADFQNSHHRNFNAIRPESLADCNRLAVKRLTDAFSAASRQ